MTEENNITNMAGWVYWLSNPSNNETLFKVGETSRSPKERAEELFTTSIAMPFKIERAIWVKDRKGTETLMHKLLKHKRTNRGREFFDVSKEELNRIFDAFTEGIEWEPLDPATKKKKSPKSSPQPKELLIQPDRSELWFSDGVLKILDDRRTEFQPTKGIPTFQMGIEPFPYIPYDPGNPQSTHLEILEFFKKIYPDPILREYVLTLYSSCVEGANHEQKFYVMTGSGGNGKTTVMNLLQGTFGNYSATLDSNVLTRRKGTNSLGDPRIRNILDKRIVYVSGIEEGEKLNTALIKELTDPNLTIQERNKQTTRFTTFKLFLESNELPAVTAMDTGTWRKLRVIPHEAKFIEEGNRTNFAIHTYPSDPLLNLKITPWYPYFAGMLIWYYEHRYLRDSLKEPAQVTAASNKYKEENDPFAAFCQECLVKEVGTEVKASDVLVRYKGWMRFNPGKKVMQKPAIIQKMAELYGQPIDGRIFEGVRIREEGENPTITPAA